MKLHNAQTSLISTTWGNTVNEIITFDERFLLTKKEVESLD